MADSNVVAYHGAAYQTIYNSVDTQVSAMKTAGMTGERISGEVGAAYIANSSTRFQNAVMQWVDDYNSLVGLVNQTTADLHAAARIIDQEEETAGQAPQNWVSNDTLSALTGGR